jgi:cell division protein FtsB
MNTECTATRREFARCWREIALLKEEIKKLTRENEDMLREINRLKQQPMHDIDDGAYQ